MFKDLIDVQKEIDNISLTQEVNGEPFESVPRGENHPFAKFMKEQVDKIRLCYAEGVISQQKLANEYNVSRTCICKIVNGKRWVSLQGGI